LCLLKKGIKHNYIFAPHPPTAKSLLIATTSPLKAAKELPLVAFSSLWQLCARSQSFPLSSGRGDFGLG